MSPLSAFLLPLFLTLTAALDGWLGVFLDSTEHPQVMEVIPDSPAAKAGLQIGDRFLSVNDVATPTTAAFVTAIQAGKPGQRVRLKVQRDGKELAVVVRLAERPPEDEIPAPQGTESGDHGQKPKSVLVPADRATGRRQPPSPAAEPAPVGVQDGGSPFLGIGLMEADGGLQVTEVVAASPAATAGIEVDDLLVQFGKARIQTMADLEAALGGAKVGQQIELQLRHDGGRKSVVVTLGSKPGARSTGGLTPRPQPAITPPVAVTPAVPPAQAKGRGWLGINQIDNNGRGIGVGGMAAGGPVEQAGLQVGDRIVAIDGQEVNGAGELMAFLDEKSKPGQVVVLDIARGDQRISKKVTLGTPPAANTAAMALPAVPVPAEPAPPAPLVVPPPADQRGWLGLNLEGSDEGIRIASVVPDRAAAQAGLAADDRIVSLDGKDVADMEALQAFMARTKPGQVIAVGIVRGEQQLTRKVTLGTREAIAPTTSVPAEAKPLPPAERGVDTRPLEAAATEAVKLPKAFGTDLQRAERRAARSGKPLLLLVGSLSDAACQAQLRAFADAGVAKVLGGFECVFVDAESNEAAVERHQIRELPTLMLGGPDGARHAGFLPIDKLMAFLGQAKGDGAGAPRADSRPSAPTRPAAEATPGASAESASREAMRAEIEALRKELAELRRALEELRGRRGGRE